MSHPALDAPPFEPATVSQCTIITAGIQGRELAQELILLTPTEFDVAARLNGDDNHAAAIDDISMEGGESGSSSSGYDDSDLSTFSSSGDEDFGDRIPQAQDPPQSTLMKAFWMSFKSINAAGEEKTVKYTICENTHGVHKTHVYRAKVLHNNGNGWVATGEEVAIKVVSWKCIRSCRRTYLSEDFVKEIEALQYISRWHHEEGANNNETHVLSTDTIMANNDFLFIVMPYCSGGDLVEIVARHPSQRLSEDESRYWFNQILTGLETLQRMRLCHKDLSPENMMILNNNDRRSLVIDFGMCLRIPYSEDGLTYSEHGQQKHLIRQRNPCGKLPHVSPEIFDALDFDGHAVDIWAAGTILLFLLSGKRLNNLPKLGLAAFDDFDLGVTLSPRATDLLSRMFQLDPANRLNLEQIRSHPFCRPH